MYFIMKRHPAVKILVIAGICLVGFFLLRGSKPVSKNAIPRETSEAGKATAVADSQPHAPTVVVPVQTPELTTSPQEAPQAPRQKWHEQLSALHGIGKLFGIGGEERMKQLQDFVESLDVASVPAAVKELQELQTQNPTETGQDLRLRLLQKWGQSDIRSAAGWATQMPAGSDRQEAIATMAGVWAGQNFAEANTWASQLSDVNERQSALVSVADSAVYSDPVNALKLAGTLTASSERDSVITRAVRGWARNSPDDAVAWAKQIPDEGLREQAIANVATSWAEKNPVAAGNLAVNSLQAGPLQNRAIIGIVQRWAATDFSGAKAWVDKFPEGPLREVALKQL
jgi:hypothetical protein